MSEPSDDEVPVADWLEQQDDVEPHEPSPGPSIGIEVPEADAIEQAQEVFDDDDSRRA